MTKGRFYQYLCSTTYDIPIGIYRTDPIPRAPERGHNKVKNICLLVFSEFCYSSYFWFKDANFKKAPPVSRMEIDNLIQTRMEALGITSYCK
jgi:hypothetical protein